MQAVDNFAQFMHPATILIAGKTQSGKSTLVRKIVRSAAILFHPPPQQILWVSSVLPSWRNESVGVQFLTEIPDPDSLDPATRRLIIFDDWQGSGNEINSLIAKFFTRYAHHTNSSVIHITQTIFSNVDKYHRIVSLNSSYLIVFRNLRDRNQIKVLGEQLFPGNGRFLDKVIADVTKINPYGYVVLDLHPETSPLLRVRTSILPEDRFSVAYSPP